MSLVNTPNILCFLAIYHHKQNDSKPISAPICLKSKNYVWFSDTLDFYNVWKPDKTSGFQMSGLKLSGSPYLEYWNRTSEIRTKVSGFQTTSENRRFLQPDMFRKRRNPDVRISDIYYILIRCRSGIRTRDLEMTRLLWD